MPCCCPLVPRCTDCVLIMLSWEWFHSLKESVSGCQILFWSHFCHANVSTSTGCCCDCGFIDDVILWDIYTFLLWFLIMLAMLHLVGPSGFWLVPENFVFFCPIRIKARGLWVISCVLSQNDPWSSLAHHVCLNCSPLLCSRWKVPISAQNVTDIRSLCENLTSKYAEPQVWVTLYSAVASFFFLIY